MNQKYCEDCKALIEENADYCNKCGAMTLKMKNNIKKAEQKIYAENREKHRENKEKYRKKYWIKPDKNKDFAIILSLLPFTGHFYLKNETILLFIIIILEIFGFLFLTIINFALFIILYIPLVMISFIKLFDLVNKNNEVNDVSEVYGEKRSVFYSKNFGKVGSFLSLLLGIILIIILFVSLSEGVESFSFFIMLICILSLMPAIFMNIRKDKISVRRYVTYGVISLFGGIIILGFLPSIFFFAAAILLSKENNKINNVNSSLECYKCGKINKNEAIFCGNCRTLLEKPK